MKRTILLVLVLVPLFLAAGHPAEARSLTGGRGIPVVSEPRDLDLVNLKPMSDYLYADLKNKGDFGLVRRVALEVKGKQLGLPNARKKSLHTGIVVKRGSSGHSSAVLVAVGEFQFKDLRNAMVKDYEEYMSTVRGAGKVGETEVGGIPFTTFAYSERPYEVCLGQLPLRNAWIWAAVPVGDRGVLEETVAVIKGEEKLNDVPPANIECQTTFQLSGREVERMVRFNRPKGALRETFAKGMKTVARKLGVPQSDDQAVPLEERIRGQLALSQEVDVTYKWDRDARNSSAYQVQYALRMKDDQTAETLRELIAEQIVRMTESSRQENDAESLGRLTVSASGDEVNLGFLLDTPEAQYEHVSLLLSQLFRYRNVMGFIDRHGQN